MWIVLLRKKSDALEATRQFITMVATQLRTKIQEWMSDAGREYTLKDFEKLLKNCRIKILQSVPHQPQQNGHAKHFNQTIMDKAQALHLDACLPQSWWEFAVLHALHLYNRTPI